MIAEKTELITEAKNVLNSAKETVEENSALFDECIEYYGIWLKGKDGRDCRLFISNNYTGVNLWVSLAPEDSIKDFNLFLDNIPYEIEETSDYVDGRWIRHTYRPNRGILHVFCQYVLSEKCKLVETGEFKPVYKRICI